MAIVKMKSTTGTNVPEHDRAERDEQREWIEAAAQGDVVAFRRLYDRHFDFVARCVGRVMGPGPELEDVVQEVFVQVFRSLESYRHESAFTTWLYRVAYNVTVSHLRKKPRTVELSAYRPLRDSKSSWGELEARDMCRVLYAALENVAPDHREAFLLYEVEGMKLREIAELAGVSINTIAARVRRTREKMHSILEQATTLEGGRD
jgi:RNA polymerase sigma-70 factor (ECF subfamily)